MNMNIAEFFLNYFNNTDAFIKLMLLVFLIVYNFFALALTFQIFTYNRLMTQTVFAPIFKIIGAIHVALSFILLLIVIFSL